MRGCRPEQVSTQEHGKMLKRIDSLEDAKEANNRKIERQKRRITRKERIPELLNKFEMEGFMAQQGLWSREEPSFANRGALPREEGDATREHKAMHEENFLCSWLREDVKSKTKEDKEVRKDVGKKGKRGRERKEDETVVKRKCVNTGQVEAFDIFNQGEISECDSECGSVVVLVKWSSALVSNDICVPPPFTVEVVGVGEMWDSGWVFGSECGSDAVSGVRVVRLLLLL